MLQFLKHLWNWLTHWFRQPEPPPAPPPSNIDWESHFFALLKEVEKGKRWEVLQPFLIERQVDLHGLAEGSIPLLELSTNTHLKGAI